MSIGQHDQPSPFDQHRSPVDALLASVPGPALMVEQSVLAHQDAAEWRVTGANQAAWPMIGTPGVPVIDGPPKTDGVDLPLESVTWPAGMSAAAVGRWLSVGGTGAFEDTVTVRRFPGGAVLTMTQAPTPPAKATVQTLNISDAGLRKAVDQLPIAVSVKDAEGRFIYVNHKSCKMLQRPLQEIIGCTPLDLLDPALVKSSFDQEMAMRPGDVSIELQEDPYFDTEWRHIYLHMACIDIDGQRLFLAAAISAGETVDQARRLEAEKAVTDAIFRAVPANLYVKDTHQRYLRVNELACQDFNLTEQQMIGKTADELFGTDVANEFRRQEADIPSGTMTRSEELALIGLDGTQRHYASTYSRVRAGGQELIIVAAMDVTENKRAAEALRQSEQLFRASINAVPFPLLLFGADRRLKLFNTAFELRAHQYAAEYGRIDVSVEEIVRSNLKNSRYDSEKEDIADPEVYLRNRLAVLDARVPAQREVHYSDGSTVQAHDVPIEGGGTVSFHFNITDLKRATQAAEAANQTKSQFLAMMSHEIRTPMTGVLGMIHLLRSGDLQPVQRERVNTLHSAAASLLTVLNDILDFTKLEAGHFKISAEPFSLRNLVEEVRRLMQPIADDKHLIMSMHVTDSVPDRVCGDAHRLHQVLCNLVGNAVKFTDTGRIDVVVRVTDRASTDPDIHWIRFDVRDTGTGISDDKLGDLFQPFSQLDASTSRRHSGTGLGLAIVRQLLDLMNGEVGVESTIGIGSLFWIEVPLPLSASAAYLDITHDTGIGQRADDPGAIATMPSLRILVAEDNAINQTLIQIYLTERRHRVMIVGDGQAAIEQAQTADYDLVLMDMRMPGVDGAEAIRSIRKGDRNQYTAIYALTADILLSSAVQGVRAMLDGVLAKPIEFKLLDEVLERVARGRSGHRRFCDTSMG